MSFLLFILSYFVVFTLCGVPLPTDLCCYRDEKSGCRRERCCGSTGDWVCPDSDTGRPIYSSCDYFGHPCNPRDEADNGGLDGSDGTSEKCCDIADRPGCIEPSACCPDGTWTCTIGDGVTFPCGDNTLILGEDTFGIICGQEEAQCCDPDLEPGRDDNPICSDGYVCCPTTGEWSCGIGDDTFPCGEDNYITIFESSEACITQCCDPKLEPGTGDNAICIEGHICCGTTGEWVCGDATGNEFECGKEIITREESGPSCKCCNPDDEPGTNNNNLCFEGHFCCPLTGTWECSIGDAIHFPCGGEIFTREDGGDTCSRNRGDKRGGKRGGSGRGI